jgi:DNA-binding MarR family transcriptional regulator
MAPSEILPLENLAYKLRDFYVASQREIDRIMRDRGASFARTKLLMFIGAAEWVRSTDLAEAFGHAPRTVTEAIDGLERDGLILRAPDPADRRMKRISITEQGRLAIKASEPARKKFVADVFGILEPAEIASFSAILEKLTDRLKLIDQTEAGASVTGEVGEVGGASAQQQENHQGEGRGRAAGEA